MMILALVLAMTGAVEPIAAKKGILHLADAVESSTFICIGSVAEVRSTFVPPTSPRTTRSTARRLPMRRSVSSASNAS